MENVSELLAHSIIRIMQKCYGKIVQKQVGEEMDKLVISAIKALLEQKKKILVQQP